MSLWTPVEDPRSRPRRAWVLDLCVAVVTGGSTLPQLFTSTPGALAVLVFVAQIAPLTIRRIWPVPVFAWCLLVAAFPGVMVLRTVSMPALVVAMYTVAATRSRRTSLVAAAVLQTGVLLGSVVIAGAGWWSPALTLTPFVAAALGLGLYVHTRRDLLAQLRDRAARLERERDQQGALAAAAERARISREMHDIVAHHLTVMVALSDGAVAASARSPAEATEAMRTVSATGRQALADTRRLLGVLRSDDDGRPAQLRPLPGLHDLDGLLERVRAAGLPVRHEVHGAVPDLAAGVQLTLYRLVQEALTNTMKHAGSGASALVRLDFTPDEVRVEVVDDGGGGSGVRAAPGDGAGRGLVGMGERWASFGGRVHAGPGDQRGWRVVARVPMDAAAPP